MCVCVCVCVYVCTPLIWSKTKQCYLSTSLPFLCVCVFVYSYVFYLVTSSFFLSRSALGGYFNSLAVQYEPRTHCQPYLFVCVCVCVWVCERVEWADERRKSWEWMCTCKQVCVCVCVYVLSHDWQSRGHLVLFHPFARRFIMYHEVHRLM